MIVVADTSPLNYLILVHALEVLPSLFNRVLIPDEVCAELWHSGAPPAVRDWIRTAPAWLEVRTAPAQHGPMLPDLDVGEAAAIRLAAQQGEPVFLLMDDRKGRVEAARRGIPTTGTLGVLRAAS